MSTDMNCPICEEGQIYETSKNRESEYKGVKKTIPLYYSVCDTCGSEQGNAAQSRKNKQGMMVFRKEVDGLLSGDEIKKLRKYWGITQAQAARIFGGGPVAFSKYEADDVAQSEPMDKLLRVAQAAPNAFIWLAQQNNEHAVCQKVRQKSFEMMEKSISRKDNRILPFKASPKPVFTNLDAFDGSGDIQAVG